MCPIWILHVYVIVAESSNGYMSSCTIETFRLECIAVWCMICRLFMVPEPDVVEIRLDIIRVDYGKMFRTHVYQGLVNQCYIVILMLLACRHFVVCKQMESIPSCLWMNFLHCDQTVKSVEVRGSYCSFGLV
eukprot:jgi/Botrbrau1/10984/Bobra.0234s0009.1